MTIAVIKVGLLTRFKKVQRVLSTSLQLVYRVINRNMPEITGNKLTLKNANPLSAVLLEN